MNATLDQIRERDLINTCGSRINAHSNTGMLHQIDYEDRGVINVRSQVRLSSSAWCAIIIRAKRKPYQKICSIGLNHCSASSAQEHHERTALPRRQRAPRARQRPAPCRRPRRRRPRVALAHAPRHRRRHPRPGRSRVRLARRRRGPGRLRARRPAGRDVAAKIPGQSPPGRAAISRRGGGAGWGGFG